MKTIITYEEYNTLIAYDRLKGTSYHSMYEGNEKRQMLSDEFFVNYILKSVKLKRQQEREEEIIKKTNDIINGN